MERRVMKGCARIICNCRVATRSDFATQQDRANIPFSSDNGTDKTPRRAASRCRSLENMETRERASCIFLSCVAFVYRICRQSIQLSDDVQHLLLLIHFVKGEQTFYIFSYFGRYRPHLVEFIWQLQLEVFFTLIGSYFLNLEEYSYLSEENF